MDVEYLAKLRDQTIAKHKRAEKTRGSGWHPADHGAEQRERDMELDLSDRPIAFQMDDRVVLIGECAARVRAKLAAFVGRVEAESKRDFVSFGPKFQSQVFKCAQRALGMGPILEMPTQDWNYCLHALAYRDLPDDDSVNGARLEGMQVVIVNA